MIVVVNNLHTAIAGQLKDFLSYRQICLLAGYLDGNTVDYIVHCEHGRYAGTVKRGERIEPAEMMHFTVTPPPTDIDDEVTDPQRIAHKTLTE